MEGEYSERIKTYTLGELLDIEQHINKAKFPDRYQLVLDEIKKRESITVTESPEKNDHDVYLDPLDYAGFWKRFLANLVDSIVLFLVSLPFYFLFSKSKVMAIILTLPLTFLYFAYTVYFHGRWGKTLGKMSVKIRVILVDSRPIKWKNAFLRSSVDFGFALITSIGTIMALFVISTNEYLSLNWLEQASGLQPLQTMFFRFVSFAAMIWTYSEVIVLLFNKKNRAIHDFIAGTVVVHEYSLPEEEI